MLVDQGDFKGAVDALTKVVDKHPEWSSRRYALGTAYFKLGDFNNAANWFKKVTDAEPTFVPALASLGYAQIKLKKGGEVKKTIEKMKTLDPNEALKLERDMKAANYRPQVSFTSEVGLKRPAFNMALDIQRDVPLAPLTTLKIGGPARFFVRATSEDEVAASLRMR